MPSRNIIKEYATDHYYHVYNRGVDKQPIFIDAQDKAKLLKILKRHLDPTDASTEADGLPYRKFDQDIVLLCYCLMGNHFHFLFYISGEGNSLSALMQSVLTAYTMYFNKRHKRVGTLFQGVFKASRISDDSYLTHITRYIHLNPRTYITYYYSSLRYYLAAAPPHWIKPKRILDMFEGDSYMEFLEDYEDQKDILESLKYELANC